MSLGSENTVMSKTELSAYKFMRRSHGWGSSLPLYWMPGGFFTQILGGGQGGVLWQNINPSRRTPAIWTECASSQDYAVGLIMVLGET